MADRSNIDAILSAIKDQELQLILRSAFRYFIRDIRFGRATPQITGGTAPGTNMAGGFFSATTPSTANQEFTIAHNFGRIPYLAMSVTPLDQVNAAQVRWTVSRAADSTYVYLKSPETSQPVYVYLEG